MSSGSRPSVLVVIPAAEGGLLAHARQEIAALGADGVAARESAVRIGSRPDPRADPGAVRALRREVRALRPDAVHAHGVRAGALAALALGRGLRRTRGEGPRLVVTLHNRIAGGAAVRAVGRVLLRIVARGADTVLAVSDDLVDAARAAGARDVRLAVVPAPAPAGEATGPGDGPRPDDDRAPGDGTALRILVVARLAEQKGLEDLLDAVALLEDRAPGAIRVDIVGEGPLRPALAERIEREHLPVRLLGRVDDVPAHLRASDLVVSSAVWEGQPVALQEALHAGRAIVATDAGGTRAVTGDAARLVPVGDVRALADAIDALRDPAPRAEAERASRARAARLPGVEDLTAQLHAVLVPGAPRG
ncbi:glycosyltransferase [Brachybacterium huguangmaarense]